MSILRSRFEVDKSEGRPIEFLIGVVVEQNLNAGNAVLKDTVYTNSMGHFKKSRKGA